MHPYTYPSMFVNVTSHHPPHPTTPHHPPPHMNHPPHPTPPTHSHASLHISPNVCHVTSHHPPHPTHAFPCIPTHIPQCLSCYFTPLIPHPPMPSHASLHISPNVCHVTSHHLLHPTQAYTPPHTSSPCLPMHPYPTLHLNIFKV